MTEDIPETCQEVYYLGGIVPLFLHWQKEAFLPKSLPTSCDTRKSSNTYCRFSVRAERGRPWRREGKTLRESGETLKERGEDPEGRTGGDWSWGRRVGMHAAEGTPSGDKMSTSWETWPTCPNKQALSANTNRGPNQTVNGWHLQQHGWTLRSSYWVKSVRQRRNSVWHPLYAGSKKKLYKWTYLQNTKETHSLKE